MNTVSGYRRPTVYNGIEQGHHIALGDRLHKATFPTRLDFVVDKAFRFLGGASSIVRLHIPVQEYVENIIDIV